MAGSGDDSQPQPFYQAGPVPTDADMQKHIDGAARVH